MGFWKAAIENLKGDPSAGLAGLAIVVGIGLLGVGWNPLLALGFPGGIYVLYLLKGLFDNHHLRRMADYRVQEIEATRGQPVRSRTQRALERRRAKHGKS